MAPSIAEWSLAVALILGAAVLWRFRRRHSPAEHDRLALMVAQRTHELVELKDRAEEANRLKSQFLTNISHEIRSPLSGVLGTLELALMTELTPEQKGYLELSKSSAESLLVLLDNLVDFSKIEAERIEIDHVTFSLDHCLRGAANTMLPRLDEKKMELKTHVAVNVPDRLVGDPDRLRQVLLKILDNAVTFASGGDVLLNVTVDQTTPRGPDKERSVLLLFSVQDNGPGIPAEKRDLLFQAFRFDGSTTRKYAGTGLGLAMCGRLVRLMDGRIWLDTNVKTGSRFCFTVRLGVAAEREVSPLPKPAPSASLEWTKGLRVLIAEDNRLNQVVTARLLEKQGFETLIAPNGRKALEILQWETVDLVLMDVQMPELDGLEATRRIRELEKKSGAHLPILAMTANAMQGDRDECLKAGMDGYLAKPVQSNQLYQAIQNLLVRN